MCDLVTYILPLFGQRRQADLWGLGFKCYWGKSAREQVEYTKKQLSDLGFMIL